MSLKDPTAVRLRPEIIALPAYKQGKPANSSSYKLSSNENPFDPLPGVIAAVSTETAYNRYPDASALALRERLASKHSIDVDQVHVGSGSVSVLAQLILAAAGTGDEVLYSWRSFEAYPSLVTVAGATSVCIPNRTDHGHDLSAMSAAISERTRVVIVCSPNNPTGMVVTQNEFEQFMGRVPANLMVILDEAYSEFITRPDAVDGPSLLARYPNLVVLRTFSKAYGLAGLRVGYGLGPVDILNAARATAIPLSVTAQGAAAAIASLDAETELLDRVRILGERRDNAWQALTDQGWKIAQPQGNFLWLATGEETMDVAEVLGAAGLVVRPFAREGIRVSVGEEDSVATLLRVTADLVETLPSGHPARQLG